MWKWCVGFSIASCVSSSTSKRRTFLSSAIWLLSSTFGKPCQDKYLTFSYIPAFQIILMCFANAYNLLKSVDRWEYIWFILGYCLEVTYNVYSQVNLFWLYFNVWDNTLHISCIYVIYIELFSCMLYTLYKDWWTLRVKTPVCPVPGEAC